MAEPEQPDLGVLRGLFHELAIWADKAAVQGAANLAEYNALYGGIGAGTPEYYIYSAIWYQVQAAERLARVAKWYDEHGVPGDLADLEVYIKFMRAALEEVPVAPAE